MKILLPRKLLCALLTTLVPSYTLPHALAQGEKLTSWDSTSITDFVTTMGEVKSTEFATWSDLITNDGTSVPSRVPSEGITGSIFTLTTGNTIIELDGSTTETSSLIYLTQGGALCDSSGRPLDESGTAIPYEQDSDNYKIYHPTKQMDYISGITVFKNAEGVSNPRVADGTIILGSRPSDHFTVTVNGDFAAANYGLHNNSTGTGTQIHLAPQEDKGFLWTLNVIGGKSGGSYGTKEDPTKTEILIETSVRDIYGGNATTDQWWTYESGNADFVGDSYIVFKSELEDNASNIVGGNRATANPNDPTDKQYSANFTGDTHIAVQGTAAVYELTIGGNSVGTDEQLSHPAGRAEANFNGNTHITFQDTASSRVVIGGNYTAYYYGSLQGGSTGHFGNLASEESFSTNINLIDQSEAYRIIGGNGGNALGASFYGDSNITLNTTGAVGNVIGASYLNSASDTVFEGNTNINVIQNISVLDKYGDNIIPLGTAIDPYSGIIGGFMGDFVNGAAYVDMQNKTATLRGNTNITIDFSKADSLSSDFQLSVIGGSAAGNGMNIDQQGTATLQFRNLGDTQMRKAIIGGNINIDCDQIHKDGSTITIIPKNDQSTASIARVEITVDSGNFAASNIDHPQYDQSQYDPSSPDYNPDLPPYNPLELGNMFIMGSLSAGGGKVITGSTKADITGGQFGVIVGGNAATPGETAHYTEGYDIGTLPSIYSYKYSVTDTQTGSLVMNKDLFTQVTKPEVEVELNISGASTQTQQIIAGSYISDDVSKIVGDNDIIDPHVLTQGDIKLTITGGTHKDITGGSYIGAQIASANIAAEGEPAQGYQASQGNIEMNLKAGTIDSPHVAVAGIINLADGAAGNPEIANHYLMALIDAYGAYNSEPQSIILPPTPEAWAPSTPPSGASGFFEMETSSTLVTIGQEMIFNQATTISGDYEYKGNGTTGYTDLVDMGDGSLVSLADTMRGLIADAATSEEADFFQSWLDAYLQEMADAPKAQANSNSIVVGNRKLSLTEAGSYANLANATLIKFDEVEISAGTVLSVAKQDLDLFNGRNQLSSGSTRVSFDSEGLALMTDTNTLRKTGAGTLILGENNGQSNKASSDAASNLQLVVEAGTVVLAKNSADIGKSDFKTLVVQSGATLDMRAGNFDETSGEYLSGNAGINGDLRLEVDSILRADASRDTAGSGVALEGGSLNIIGDGQVTLQFDNLNLVQDNQIAEAGHILFEEGSTYFEIVLFSELDFTLETSTNLTFTKTGGTFDGFEAQAALATDYFNANFDLTDVYLVYNANGDIVLTGAEFLIPEPSTATLSLLALVGLLARRRRKQA